MILNVEYRLRNGEVTPDLTNAFEIVGISEELRDSPNESLKKQ